MQTARPQLHHCRAKAAYHREDRLKFVQQREAEAPVAQMACACLVYILRARKTCSLGLLPRILQAVGAT